MPYGIFPPNFGAFFAAANIGLIRRLLAEFGGKIPEVGGGPLQMVVSVVPMIGGSLDVGPAIMASVGVGPAMNLKIRIDPEE